jgi:hypothetical protein
MIVTFAGGVMLGVASKYFAMVRVRATLLYPETRSQELSSASMIPIKKIEMDFPVCIFIKTSSWLTQNAHHFLIVPRRFFSPPL